jgi:CxxC-x17-CxxC domain-containing protein
MEFTDKTLICVNCCNPFVFTADEQVFFQAKHFLYAPKRCRQCRTNRSVGRLRIRVETRTSCAECGGETTVPFKPTKGLPVLCRSCIQRLKCT